MIVSAIFFIPVFASYLQTGLVGKFTTLIVAGFTFIAAIISWFTGIMLQTMTLKNRQDFEIELNHFADRFKDLKERENN